MVNHCSNGGGSENPINIHEINCVGNESRLIDCDSHVYTHFYCHHSENVAIACDGKIELGTSKYCIHKSLAIKMFGGFLY